MPFDTQALISALQSMNENARIEEAQGILNAITHPRSRKIKPGFARGAGDTFGQSSELQRRLREKDQHVNELLGSAHALSLLSGKGTINVTNALPSQVNNRDPRSYKEGTEGQERSRNLRSMDEGGTGGPTVRRLQPADFNSDDSDDIIARLSQQDEADSGVMDDRHGPAQDARVKRLRRGFTF